MSSRHGRALFFDCELASADMVEGRALPLAPWKIENYIRIDLCWITSASALTHPLAKSFIAAQH